MIDKDVIEYVRNCNKDLLDSISKTIDSTMRNLSQTILSDNQNIKDKLNEVKGTLEKQNGKIHGLEAWQSEQRGMSRKEENIAKNKLTTFQMFGIVMAAVVGLCSILGFIKSYTNDKKVESIENKLWWKQDRVIDSTTRSIKSLPLDTTNMFKR